MANPSRYSGSCVRMLFAVAVACHPRSPSGSGGRRGAPPTREATRGGWRKAVEPLRDRPRRRSLLALASSPTSPFAPGERGPRPLAGWDSLALLILLRKITQRNEQSGDTVSPPPGN